MSDTPTQSQPAVPVFEDPATCPHSQWVPWRKRRTLPAPEIGYVATVFAWCPRCDQSRMGPVEEGM